MTFGYLRMPGLEISWLNIFLGCHYLVTYVLTSNLLMTFNEMQYITISWGVHYLEFVSDGLSFAKTKQRF